MVRKEHTRLAYLISLWQVHSDGQMVWRASLEDAHSGKKRAFGDPTGLFAFLEEKLSLQPGLPKENDPYASGTTKNPKCVSEWLLSACNF